MRGPAPHPASCTFDDCRTEGECLHDQACPTVPPPEPPAVLDHKQIDAAYVAVASVCAVYPHLERTLGRVAILLNALSRPDRDGETDAEIRRRVERHAWSFIRQVLVQGQAQRQDYDAGKYTDFEDFSARIDEAARERVPMLADVLCPGGTDG